MNSNQSKNLTQKQKELVKRLERIRNNREATSQETTKGSASSQQRNKSARQNRSAPTNSSKRVPEKRSRTSKPSEFARPATEPEKTVKPKVEYRPRVVNTQKKVQRPNTRTMKKTDREHYINKLSDGNKLSKAIVLSEILGKPVALRKNNRIK